MREIALRQHDLDDALARIRPDAVYLIQDVVPVPDEGLLEVDRVFDVDAPRQVVAMPYEMLGDDGAVAARDAVATEPALFQVRRRDLQRAAFPLTGREAHRRVFRVLGRRVTAVHPDRPHRVPREVLDP